jgi:hypothetical protein
LIKTVFFNDVFALDVSSPNLTWTDLTNHTAGARPSPRQNHGFAAASGLLYVMGGDDNTAAGECALWLSQLPATQ